MEAIRINIPLSRVVLSINSGTYNYIVFLRIEDGIVMNSYYSTGFGTAIRSNANMIVDNTGNVY